MNRDEFDDLFDPELLQEFKEQFNELQMKKQQEYFEADPKTKWLLDFSYALGKQGIRYFKDEEQDSIYIQLPNNTLSDNRVESISMKEIEEYMEMRVPAEAVAAAIRAGLISNAFKFWMTIDDEPED